MVNKGEPFKLLSLALVVGLMCSCASTPGRDRPLAPVMQTVFCTDGRSVVVSTTTAEVALFDVLPLRFRALLTSEETKSKVSLASVLRSPPVACSPDSRLVVAGLGGKMVAWDIDTRKMIFSRNIENIRDLAFLPGGETFLLIGDTVRRYSSATGLFVDEFTLPSGTVATTVAISPDGESILVGLSNGHIVEIQVHSRHILRVLEGHNAAVTGIVFSPDGLTFASTAGQFDPRIWNRGEKTPVARSMVDTGSMKDALGKAQRFTDALVLFGWLLGSARGFEVIGAPTMGPPPKLRQGVERASRQTSQHCEPRIAYSPDGRYLATTANISLLSGEYHLLLVDLVRNQGRVISGIYGCSVSISQNSQFVATGGLGAPELRELKMGWQ